MKLTQSKKIEVFWILLTLVSYSFSTNYVSWVSNDPYKTRWGSTGSVFGGSILFIEGSNFDDVDYNNNLVLVGSDKCILLTYYITANNLRCQLPFKYYGIHKSVKIRVFVRGEEYPCHSGDCTLEFHYVYTPILYSIYPQATFAGKTINFYGYIRGSYTTIKDVTVGEQKCGFTDDQVERNKNMYWGGYAECILPQDLATGYHDLNLRGQTGTGFAKKMQSAYGFRVGFENQKYNLKIHPLISSLSSKKGYLAGQRIVVKGTGFGTETADVQVQVDGNPCQVQKVNDIELHCTLQKRNAQPSMKVYEGNAGLLNQFFSTQENMHNFMLRKERHTGFDCQHIMLSLENKLNLEHYVQRVLGIFTPTENGEYIFYSTGDDHTRLYISENPIDFRVSFNETDMMKQLCDVPWTRERNYHYYEDGRQKCTKTMMKGKKYYMVYMHKEYGGNDYFALAVQVPNSDVNKPNRLPQIQEVHIDNDPVREIQEISIWNADGGTFDLFFTHIDNNDSTKNYQKNILKLAWNISSNDLRNAIYPITHWWHLVTERKSLDKNGAITDVAADTKGYRWKLTFNRNKFTPAKPFLDLSKLTGTSIQQKVATIQEPSPVVSGTFKLKYGTHITEDIYFHEWWGGMRYKLEQLVSLINGVSVTDKDDLYDGKKWFISLDSIMGNGLSLEVAENKLTGGVTGKPPIKINPNYRQSSTDLFHSPVPSDYLSTKHTKPQLTLKVKDIRAGCGTIDCDYEYYSSYESLKVESFSLSNHTVDIVLKSGYAAMPNQNLITDKSKYYVEFGGTVCEISSFILPNIKVTLPTNANNKPLIEAGDHKPKVHVDTLGFFEVEANSQLFPVTISGVSPSSGSKGGGLLITISGGGFALDLANISVNIGNQKCDIKSVTNTSIQCMTDPLKDSNTLKVTSNGKTQTSAGFQYSDDKTPLITNISPSSSSPILKNDLVITGQKFGTDISKLKLYLVPDNNKQPQECNIFEAKDTEIKCRLSGGTSGKYTVTVQRQGMGNSITSSANVADFEYKLVVSSISPNKGSREGGTLLTITGQNFSTNKRENQVLVGPNQDFCIVKKATNTEIQCVTSKPKSVLNGPQEVIVLGRIVEKAICSGVCKFEFDSNKTPNISNVNPIGAKAGEAITISGVNLNIVQNKDEISLSIGEQAIETALITSVSDTKIVFNMPVYATGAAKMSLSINTSGNSIYT